MLVSGEHRLLACRIRQPAECILRLQSCVLRGSRQAAANYRLAACAPQNKTRPRVALESIVRLTTDPAQIAFGGSPNSTLCVRQNIRLPPAAINLLV